MKSKKILIAALSLGLIFVPTKPPVFAADAELISTDEDRFNEIKQSDIRHYQTMENTYQNKKDGISEKQIANFSNVNKIYKQLETLRTEKQNYESELEKANEENASDAYKNDIITKIERVDKDIDQLEEEYEEVVRIREDLRINAEETDAYLVAYKKTLKAVRKSQNLLDLNKAKLKNEIKIIMIEKAITSSEKDTYFEEVDKASTIEELDKIRQEVLKIKDEHYRLKQENEENPEIEPDDQSPNPSETTAPNEEELKAAKESAIENLKSKSNLTEDQEKSFQEEISNAENLEELAEINKKVNEADEKAKKEKELEENKKLLIENLNSKENLRPDQKDEFEKQIAEANDKEALAKIEEKINVAVEVANKEKIAEKLKAAKESAIENLKTKDNLTEAKEKSFQEEINIAGNIEEIAEINKKVDEAEQKAIEAKELSEAKDNAKQSLESSEHIDSEQKVIFENQIEEADTIDKILEIENNIKLADENAKKEKIAQELANSKQILEEKLENTILTQDQKDEFEKQIVEATDKETLANIEEEITLAIEVANKEKTAEELKAAKESAIENLKTKDNLTEAQEKLFEEAISNAENLEELAEINKKIDEADEKAKQEKVYQELENAKQLLEEKLENTGLSPEQKDTFKNRILKAESQAELETIESDINQADEKAKKEKASQELENAKTALAEKLLSTSLSQDQKDSFLEKIHNVTDLERLEAIDKEIEIASNQVDENIENETEKDPSNEETPSTPDPEEEKPKDEEKNPSEENPNGEDASNLPGNQDDNTTENPDPSNEDPVDDDNELENNPQNPDLDNGNTDSSDTSENVEDTPTDDNSANGRENNTADGENPEKTSPEGQRPRNTKITRPIFDNTTPVYRPLESPHYLPSTITINETSTAKKDTIELKDDLKYLKKGTYKISDLEAKRDKIEAAIKKNKATVRAIGILEDLAPKTLAKNRAKINALLAQSQRLLAQANYALAEYNYLLSK